MLSCAEIKKTCTPRDARPFAHRAVCTELAAPNLCQSLFDYFKENEEKEIKRIASLMRFFQLDTCLTANLAKYFDDQNFTGNIADYQCGHCSVCRGQVAVLEHSQSEISWPSDECLKLGMQELANRLNGKINQPLSLESYCRFFAGMTVPIFGRNKVRQLSSFGLCEQQRYQAIRQKVAALL